MGEQKSERSNGRERVRSHTEFQAQGYQDFVPPEIPGSEVVSDEVVNHKHRKFDPWSYNG